MTQVKLQRERALADRRREKQARRAAPKEQSGGAPTGAEDPDLAGIRLGPQPPQDWQITEE